MTVGSTCVYLPQSVDQVPQISHNQSRDEELDPCWSKWLLPFDLHTSADQMLWPALSTLHKHIKLIPSFLSTCPTQTHTQFAYKPNCSTEENINTTLHFILSHLKGKTPLPG